MGLGVGRNFTSRGADFTVAPADREPCETANNVGGGVEEGQTFVAILRDKSVTPGVRVAIASGATIPHRPLHFTTGALPAVPTGPRTQSAVATVGPKYPINERNPNTSTAPGSCVDELVKEKEVPVPPEGKVAPAPEGSAVPFPDL